MGSDKLLMSAPDAETSQTQAAAVAPGPGPGSEKTKDEAMSRITSAFQGLLASGKSLADHLAERWLAEKPLFKKARLPRMLLLDQCDVVVALCILKGTWLLLPGSQSARCLSWDGATMLRAALMIQATSHHLGRWPRRL